MDLRELALQWGPPAAALAGVVLALILDAWERQRLAVNWMSIAMLAAGALALTAAFTAPVTRLGESLITGGGYSAVAGVCYLLAAATLAAGRDSLAVRASGGQVAVLVGLGTIAAHALASSLDVLVLLIALEAAAVIAYGLVAAARTARAQEAALKYLIQGGIATALTIWGLGVVFALTGGAVAFGEAGGALSIAPARPAMLALGLLLAAFAFKLGAFPFHSWAPDAYETAEPIDAAFIASVPKVATFVAMLVIFQASVFSGAGFAQVGVLFALLAAASVLFGNLGALRQTAYARMLGYSAIAQAGYGLIGLAGGRHGVAATTAFALTYAVGVVLAYVAAQGVREVRPRWDGSIGGLAGLGREAPLLSASITVGMLSLTGIPLFAGFWGKLLVFVAAASVDMTWLAIVGMVASVVSFGYYGAVIRSLYAEEPTEEGERAVLGGSATRVAILLAAVVLLAGVAPLVTGLSPVYAFLSFL